MPIGGSGSSRLAMRLARLRSICAAAALTLVPAGMSWAAPGDEAVPDDQRVDAVLDQWRCPIAAYLERIRRFPEKLQDRYLILWGKRHPAFYVQCIFHDEDRQIYCEAASGFFRYADRIANFATPERVAALANLGFSTDGSKGNFSRDGDFHNADETATIMLATLARVFALGPSDALEFNAPFLSKHQSNRVKASRTCVPISALDPGTEEAMADASPAEIV